MQGTNKTVAKILESYFLWNKAIFQENKGRTINLRKIRVEGSSEYKYIFNSKS